MADTTIHTRKHTYLVDTPYGVFTRTTGHVYTHLVVGCVDLNYYQSQLAAAERRLALRHGSSGLPAWAAHLRVVIARNQEPEKHAGAMTWSHSLANASRASERGMRVLGVYEVPQPEGL
jgi:hypothetical protein